MIELVFFGMIGVLGFLFGEVHNSRKHVTVKEVNAERQTIARIRVRRHIKKSL